MIRCPARPGIEPLHDERRGDGVPRSAAGTQGTDCAIRNKDEQSALHALLPGHLPQGATQSACPEPLASSWLGVDYRARKWALAEIGFLGSRRGYDLAVTVSNLSAIER